MGVQGGSGGGLGGWFLNFYSFFTYFKVISGDLSNIFFAKKEDLPLKKRPFEVFYFPKNIAYYTYLAGVFSS